MSDALVLAFAFLYMCGVAGYFILMVHVAFSTGSTMSRYWLAVMAMFWPVLGVVLTALAIGLFVLDRFKPTPEGIDAKG